MSYTTNNPRELKDAILRRLGAPIVNVEVTEEQIYDCIARALELYGEYHYDGLHKSYATFVITEEQAKTGVFDLKGKNIFAVTQILRHGMGMMATLDGYSTLTWFTDFVMKLTGTGMGSCGFYGPSAFTGDLGYFSSIMSYRTLLQDVLNPLPDYWFNEASGQLKVIGKLRAGDLLIIEVYTRSYASVDTMMNDTVGFAYAGCDTDYPTDAQRYDNPNLVNPYLIGASSAGKEDGSYNNRWVKDYATALVKELNGTILAKHQGMQLPGGVTIDGVRIINEARDEIERLREELDLLGSGYPIMMG